MAFTSERAREAGKKTKPGKHTKTKQWEVLHAAIVTTHAARFNEVLRSMSNEDFAKMYVAILKYFKPTIVHNINEDTTPPTITFENVSKQYEFDIKGKVVKV